MIAGMTSEELIAGIEDDYCPHSPVNDEAAAFGLALLEVVRERDMMRDMIRLAKQRADATNPAHAWHYLVEALDLDTDSPLVDLSATTEQETEK